jgi:hypothetical protein
MCASGGGELERGTDRCFGIAYYPINPFHFLKPILKNTLKL